MTKRVLYAEDEPSNRKIMELAFRGMDVDLDLAGDGDEALRLCADNDYDLVLLDQYMPGKNGDEVARELQRRGASPLLVAITSDDSWTSTLLRAGFSDVFIKPLVGGDFRERLRRLLGI